ncbi:MAG TPA: YdeI/OmpD-associated family protein [Chloroflexota bacterium]|nr:YdeI/OmpD-associated family protein [Chloroflexota bacterium]
MSQPTRVSAIRCEATLRTVDGWTLLRLPEEASRRLPSRGQVAVRGAINGHAFQTVLEPDGSFGHWMRIERDVQQAASVLPGDTVSLDLEPVDAWPEPNVPQDFAAALSAAPEQIQHLWNSITPMAHWEWVRWINATRNPDTRQRRVEVSISKMKSGKRRPCCFNLAACTDPDLSRNGKLIEPA